jgi:hypothetical protein
VLGPIHCALGCVEPELEPAGEEGRDARHHPLPTGQARGLKAHGPAVAHMNIAVVGVAHKAVTAVLRASPFPADPKASSSWIFCRLTRSRHPLLLTASNVRAFGRLVPFLLCPLLTPTPRSRTLRYAQSRLRDATQVSRGKFNRLPRAPAGSTVPAPCLRSGKLLMAVDFAVHGPLVRPGRLHIRFLFVGPRVCSTLPLDPRLAATPLRFANPSPPSGWIKDLHLQTVEHARHTADARIKPAQDDLGRLMRIWTSYSCKKNFPDNSAAVEDPERK